MSSMRTDKRRMMTTVVLMCLCVSALLETVVVSSAAYIETHSGSYDYGDFISDYIRLQTTSSINWYQGVTLCASYGTGWGIAGIYNSGGDALISTFLTGSEYFGGWVDISSARAEYFHQFVWKAGRFTGWRISSGYSNNGFVCQNINNYCPYGAGEPRAIDEIGFNLFTNGKWNDVYANIAESRNSVICERSACTKKADCVESNTASVSGLYAPNCVCTCMAGYRGPKCQVSDAVVNVSDTSYAVWCESSRLDAPSAQSMCISKGPGWTLASIPSLNADTAIRNLSPGNIWTGGSPVTGATSSLYGWQYGRHGGEYISVGSTCIGGVYCNWAPGNPDKADCQDGGSTPPEKDIVVSVEFNRAWNDLSSNGCASVLDFETFCYACEQSVCSIDIDCVAINTINVTGAFYPDCQCNCKEGFGGSRCEANTTAILIDATEYRVLCDKANVDVATAQALCQALGSEWSIASIPSLAVQQGLSQLAPTGTSIRIGSQHTGSSTSCQTWMYGRLAGVSLCSSGVYTNWAGSQPSGASSCGDGAAGSAQPEGYGMMVNDLWTNAFYGTCGRRSSPRCVACERSLCRKEDCAPKLQPQGYFPLCNCRTATSTVTFHKNSSTPSTTLTPTNSVPKTMTATFTTSTSHSSSLSVTDTYNTPTISHNTYTQSLSSSIISQSSTRSLIASATPTVTQSHLVTLSQASHTTTISSIVTTSLGSGSVSVTSTFGATQSELDICEIGPTGPCAYIRAGYVQKGNSIHNLEEFNQSTTITTKCNNNDAAFGMAIDVPFDLWNTGNMMVSLLLVEGSATGQSTTKPLHSLTPTKRR